MVGALLLLTREMEIIFDYWINKASATDRLGWYIFANVKKKFLKLLLFYSDLILAFEKVGGKLDCIFSSVLETRKVPLWNNVMVTNDNSTFGGPLLKSVGIHKIKDVVRQGKLISFQEIAQCCAIQNINAGRIVGRLKQHIDYNLIEEKREGPANHICNWLVKRSDIPSYDGVIL